MTPMEWKQRPPLVPLRDLLDVGLTAETIEALRFEVKRADQPVPFRRIACIRVRRKFIYRRDTVSVLLGREWQ